MGDLSSGVHEDDVGLFFDCGAPLTIVADHGGAVVQQPEQRMGEGWLAGAVAADEPTHHREVFGETPPWNDHGGPAVVPGHVVSQRTLSERAEDH